MNINSALISQLSIATISKSPASTMAMPFDNIMDIGTHVNMGGTNISITLGTFPNQLN